MTEQKKNMTRKILLIGGPLVVLVVSGWMYFTGGRYMTTENAYVKTDIISVVPEVSGRLTQVNIIDNQQVKKGDVLMEIDPASYKIAESEAQAALAATATKIRATKAQYSQKEEQISAAQDDYDLAKKNYDRRLAVQKKNKSAISPEEMDDSRNAMTVAKNHIAVLEEERDEILAMLDGNPDIAVEDHPDYKQAEAALNKAKLDLERTVVRADNDGAVRHAPHAGDYARAGQSITDLAVSESTWIEANYKETALTNVKIGQPVTVTIDTYPNHEWHGKVESISPATESEFSILPAQNSSGNWVKVVQRIPVRIKLDQDDMDKQHLPLRAGMSTEVTIDTGSYPRLPAAFAGTKK